MDRKILDRIKKCLALAKSGNANEAATALRQAQALMEKHGVTQADINLSDVSKETRDAGKSQTIPRYRQWLVGAICNTFGVISIFETEFFSGHRKVNFIGVGARPKIAAYAYEVLLRQLIRDRSNYLKTLKRFKRVNKIRKADLFAEQWICVAAGKAAEIAIPKEHQELINQYKERDFPKLTSMKSRAHKVKSGDGDAILSGQRAGSNVNIHHGMNGADPVKAITNG